MATIVNYFLDTISFSAATAVFTDIDLTTKAPDGFYKYGTLNRQQSSGLLQTGVECSTLGPCNLNQFTMNYGPTCISACTVEAVQVYCPDCIAGDVTIATQIWTKCNLTATTYSDGTVIPQVTDPNAWSNLTTGAWCYYDNNATTGATYGKLYNVYAVLGIHNAASYSNAGLRKSLAPTGYHIPTDSEWTTLTANLGGGTWTSTYGGNDAYYQPLIGDKLKEVGDCHWDSPGGTNDSGFTGLPGGVRATAGYFISIQTNALFGSATLSNPSLFQMWGYGLGSGMFTGGDKITKEWVSSTQGFSIRLIKNI